MPRITCFEKKSDRWCCGNQLQLELWETNWKKWTNVRMEEPQAQVFSYR